VPDKTVQQTLLYSIQITEEHPSSHCHIVSLEALGVTRWQRIVPEQPMERTRRVARLQCSSWSSCSLVCISFASCPSQCCACKIMLPKRREAHTLLQYSSDDHCICAALVLMHMEEPLRVQHHSHACLVQPLCHAMQFFTCTSACKQSMTLAQAAGNCSVSIGHTVSMEVMRRCARKDFPQPMDFGKRRAATDSPSCPRAILASHMPCSSPRSLCSCSNGILASSPAENQPLQLVRLGNEFEVDNTRPLLRN
jgi:hypothetical protein